MSATSKLTKRSVEAIPVPEKGDAKLWDSELRGFGVRVTPNGVRSYFLNYRNGSGRERRLTLGRHGEIATEHARRLAQDAMAEVRGGGDPAERRAKLRAAPTMADLSDRYLAEHARAHKKPTSAKEDADNLRRHVLPTLGKRKVQDVTRDDVQRLHQKLGDTPYAANRVLALLSKMFNLAEVWGHRPDGSNPTRHVKKFRERKRERFLSPAELGRLGAVLAEVERDGSALPSVVPMIRLLTLTGARLSEIRTLRWEYVDWDGGFIRLPDSKTGGKSIPLTPPIVEVLRALPHEDGNPWVIPGHKKGEPLVNATLPWHRIRARAGLDGVRLHDLRHTYASLGASRNYGLPVIGALLGHHEAQTTKRYAHLADDPMKQAAADISESVAAALRSETSASHTERKGNVVRIGK